MVDEDLRDDDETPEAALELEQEEEVVLDDEASEAEPLAPSAGGSGEGGRVARLARERTEYKERLAAAEARAQALHESMLMSQQRNGNAEAEPLDQWGQWARSQQQSQANLADQLDRTNFKLLLQENPTYKRYAEEVERMFQAERQAGRAQSRENLLYWVSGRNRYLAEAKANAEPRKKAAAVKRAAAETTPTGMRSSVSQSKREPTPKDRLLNVRI